MKDEEIAPYLNKQIIVVIPIRGKVSQSVSGILNFSGICYWLPGNPSTLFYASDVQTIEISEKSGIVFRLF